MLYEKMLVIKKYNFPVFSETMTDRLTSQPTKTDQPTMRRTCGAHRKVTIPIIHVYPASPALPSFARLRIVLNQSVTNISLSKALPGARTSGLCTNPAPLWSMNWHQKNDTFTVSFLLGSIAIKDCWQEIQIIWGNKFKTCFLCIN